MNEELGQRLEQFDESHPMPELTAVLGLLGKQMLGGVGKW